MDLGKICFKIKKINYQTKGITSRRTSEVYFRDVKNMERVKREAILRIHGFIPAKISIYNAFIYQNLSCLKSGVDCPRSEVHAP